MRAWDSLSVLIPLLTHPGQLQVTLLEYSSLSTAKPPIMDTRHLLTAYIFSLHFYPKRGQQLKNEQKSLPKCVHYSEVPLGSLISYLPLLIASWESDTFCYAVHSPMIWRDFEWLGRKRVSWELLPIPTHFTSNVMAWVSIVKWHTVRTVSRWVGSVINKGKLIVDFL